MRPETGGNRDQEADNLGERRVLSASERAFFRRWQLIAVALSILPGWTHVFAAPEHFREWIGYGLFFAIAAVCQVAYAFLLGRRIPPSPRLLWAGVLGNAAILALWAVTRTVGVPFFGPGAGEVEPVGVLDLLSTAAEAALIACLFVLLRARRSVMRGMASR